MSEHWETAVQVTLLTLFVCHHMCIKSLISKHLPAPEKKHKGVVHNKKHRKKDRAPSAHGQLKNALLHLEEDGIS